MPDFEIYIDDDRYSIPTFHLITAVNVDGARAVAESMLASSGHHQGVELRQEGQSVFATGSLAAALASDCSRQTA